MGDQVLQYAITIENGDLKKQFANYFQTENTRIGKKKINYRATKPFLPVERNKPGQTTSDP